MMIDVRTELPSSHGYASASGGKEGRGAEPHFIIRPATVADLPACAAIVNDYIDATEWLPRVKSREEIAGFFTPDLIASRTVLVAETGSEVVAYVSVSGDGFLYAIYLAPAARGRGVGRRLMDEVKSRCPDRIELTVFEPNDDARRFYVREGFVEVPEGRKDDTDEGVPVLLMRWRPAA